MWPGPAPTGLRRPTFTPEPRSNEVRTRFEGSAARLPQLEPVPERVVDIEARSTPGKCVVLAGRDDPPPRRRARSSVEVVDDEAGMSFAGGRERFRDTDMQRLSADPEPAAAAPGELDGFSISSSPSRPP